MYLSHQAVDMSGITRWLNEDILVKGGFQWQEVVNITFGDIYLEGHHAGKGYTILVQVGLAPIVKQENELHEETDN